MAARSLELRHYLHSLPTETTLTSVRKADKNIDLKKPRFPEDVSHFSRFSPLLPERHTSATGLRMLNGRGPL